VPRVTVAIAAHDAGRFLAETLDSVRAQSFDDLELIVADDGSTDDTAAIAESGGATVIRRRQGGPAAARNDAIARGSGELIAILDADDLWLPGKLELQVAQLDRAPGVVLVATAAETFGGPAPPAEPLREGRVTEALIRGSFVTASSVLFRREAFEAAGRFDTDPGLISVEDYDLWLRLSLLGEFGAVPRTLVRRRWHDANLSADPLRLTRRTLRAVEKFERLPGSEPYAAAVARRKSELCYLLGRGLLGRGDGAGARPWLRRSRELDPRRARSCRALGALSLLPRPALLAIHRLREAQRRRSSIDRSTRANASGSSRNMPSA